MPGVIEIPETREATVGRAVSFSEGMNAPPLTVIERKPGWRLLDLGELWRYRELLYFLTWRDIKVRYKQTFLGVVWALLQPLAAMLVFALFVGRLAGASAGIEHYGLFVFAGMVAWTFFSNAVTSAGNSVVANERLVTKVYFPRLLVPMSAVGAALFDALISVGLLGVMMAIYGVAPGWQFLLAPAMLLLLVLTAAGFGTLLAALIVAQRDFRYVLTFGVQLWMFATPAIYAPAEAFGETARAILPLNPVYGLVLNFRQCILGGPLDLYALGVSSAIGLGMLLVGTFYFRRVERSFADII